MKKTLTFFAFLLVISFFGNNIFAQKSNEKEIFKTEAKNIKTHIKNGNFGDAINLCNQSLFETPSMKKEIFSLKFQIAKASKKAKMKIYENANRIVDIRDTKKDKYIIAIFDQDKYFFVNEEGDELPNLGKWNDANDFDLNQNIFTKVCNEKKEKYLLDKQGNSYLLAESIEELKMQNKKCEALSLTRFSEFYTHNLLPNMLESALKIFSKEIFEQTQLKVLIINDHEISEIPSEIGTLTNLIHLDLSNNKIKKLPISFENLRNLVVINFRRNTFLEYPKVLEKFNNISSLKIDIFSENDDIFPIETVESCFFGGAKKQQLFIANNYQYPREARRNGVKGTVKVEFVVEKDGSVSNIQAIESPSLECGNELIRVVKLVPRWVPKNKEGKIVRIKAFCMIKLRLGN